MFNSNGVYLSVIIPAYNEERRLPGTIREIDEYLKKQKYSYEIIVVNDGSKDRTNEVVKELRGPALSWEGGGRVVVSAIKNLRLIDNKDNHGKGYVVRQGMLKAKGQYRLFTDADNSTPIDQVEKIWPEFEKGYEIVIGSRDVRGAILDPPQSLFRRFLGETFGFFTNLIVGTWGIADSQCGFKGFTEKAVEAIFPKCRIDRFAFDPEMLIIAKKLGYKIKEIPIIWKNDPESKVKFKSMIKMGLDLFKIRTNLITKKYV